MQRETMHGAPHPIFQEMAIRMLEELNKKVFVLQYEEKSGRSDIVKKLDVMNLSVGITLRLCIIIVCHFLHETIRRLGINARQLIFTIIVLQFSYLLHGKFLFLTSIVE